MFLLNCIRRLINNDQSIIWILIYSILSLWDTEIFAKQVTLAWDANPERNLGGYRIYYGLASRSYSSMVDVGNQTNYTIFDLDDHRTYYFAVTAYNIKGTIESSFSNEVSTGGSSLPLASQESPSEGSHESGVGLIRGWVCNASAVEVEIDGGERLRAAYGTRRTDTEAVCGTANTGYGLTYNWNLLGDGVHTLRVLADGVEFGRVSFRVTTLGATYLQGISGEYSLPDFPQPGDQVAVRWSEPHQNFVIFGANPNRGTTHSSGVPHNNAVRHSTGLAFQESPSEGSYESGVGLIRGWVCNASTVEVEIDGGARLKAAYGTRRADTEAVCGTANTGYGLTYNWNLLGDGVHTLRVLADGVEFDRVSFNVSTLGQDYLRGLPPYQHTLSNFPNTGRNVTLGWSEAHQNFVIVGFQ